MAPKGGNAKKESGRAKKAENEANKRAEAAEAKERTEVDKWADGAKSSKSKQDKEEKRKAELERKAENARLLAEEEASQALRAKKAAAKASPKKGKPKPAGPGAIAAEGDPSDPNLATEESSGKSADGPQEVESFAATGIDNALDLLEVVTAKMDKASIGNQAAGIEKHPERRFKAAFNAYFERELPNIKEEQPGLRQQQYRVCYTPACNL
jgi:membrane protein involved in colicin uptake